MKRRAFVSAVAAIVSTGSIGIRAQPAQMRKIGFLRSTTAAPFHHLVEAFRHGLTETGYIENTNVAIEYRYADNRPDRLPALARGLVQEGIAVIVGNSLAAEAAKAVTSTVPIVFVTSDDPVERHLVSSLARPGGNATGFTFFGGGKLGGKRLELLAELLPGAGVIGVLTDPNWPAGTADLADTEGAAAALGKRLVVGKASVENEFESAFAAMQRAGARALIVSGAPLFSSNRAALIRRSARYALPTIYDLSEYVSEGGLLSYSASFADAYRHAGIYAGKILSGAQPADLPVQQPTRIELALNLQTAKSLSLSVPSALLARADKIIE